MYIFIHPPDARKKARAILSDIDAGGNPAATLATPRKQSVTANTARGMCPHYNAAKAERRSIKKIERVITAIGQARRLADVRYAA